MIECKNIFAISLNHAVGIPHSLSDFTVIPWSNIIQTDGGQLITSLHTVYVT